MMDEPVTLGTSAPVPARRASDLPPDAPWWAKWIVANIDEAWKWGSVWWPAFCAAAAETYAADAQQINDFVKGIIPPTWWPHVLAAAFIVSMFLRVLNLSRKKQP